MRRTHYNCMANPTHRSGTAIMGPVVLGGGLSGGPMTSFSSLRDEANVRPPSGGSAIGGHSCAVIGDKYDEKGKEIINEDAIKKIVALIVNKVLLSSAHVIWVDTNLTFPSIEESEYLETNIY